MLEFIQACEKEQTPVSQFELHEKGHGRETTWQACVFPVTQKELQEKWMHLQVFIVIYKTVIQKGKDGKLVKIQSISYRISDVLNLTAELFLKGIRGHWGIENRTHWVKDVVLNEDKNGIRNVNGAVNMATFNTLVINFLRQHVHDSISTAQIMFGQNLKDQCQAIRN